MKQIEVLLVEPGAAPREAAVWNTLDAFAELLGGPVSVGGSISDQLLIVFKDAGGRGFDSRHGASGLDETTPGMPHQLGAECGSFRLGEINGPYLLCGFEGADFASLTLVQRLTFQKRFAAMNSTPQMERK